MSVRDENSGAVRKFGRKGLVYRASFLLMLATISSRILGLAKNVLLASYFGTQMVMDAFWIAFVVPMLFLKLFTSGMGNYVPVFTHELVREDEKRAWEFGNHILGFHFVLVLLSVALGTLAAPVLVRWIAPGAMPQVLGLAAHLSRILMAIVLFLGLAEVLAPVFYSDERFLLPSLGGVLNNLAILAFLVWGHSRLSIFALAWGLVAGSVLQLLILFPGLRIYFRNLRPKFNFRHPAVRQIVGLSIPAYFSQAGIYLNNFADKFFASMLPVGAISALSYAFMVVEIPSSVITFSLDRAIMPGLSAHFGKKDAHKALYATAEWLGFLMVILVPLTLIFLILGRPIVQVIFEHGSFTAASTDRTLHALLFYSIGIPATAITGLIGTAFIADKDPKTPVTLGLIRVAVNIGLNALLIGPLGIAGLALATSLSGYFKLLLTKLIIDRKYRQADWTPFTESMKKVAAAGSLFAGALYATWRSLAGAFDVAGLPGKLLILSLTVGVATLLYIGGLLLLQQKDLSNAWNHLVNGRVK